MRTLSVVKATLVVLATVASVALVGFGAWYVGQPTAAETEKAEQDAEMAALQRELNNLIDLTPGMREWIDGCIAYDIDLDRRAYAAANEDEIPAEWLDQYQDQYHPTMVEIALSRSPDTDYGESWTGQRQESCLSEFDRNRSMHRELADRTSMGNPGYRARDGSIWTGIGQVGAPCSAQSARLREITGCDRP